MQVIKSAEKLNSTTSPVPTNDSISHSKNKSFKRELRECLELFGLLLALPAYVFFYFGTLYIIFGGVILAAVYFNDGHVYSNYLTTYFVVLFVWFLSTFF